MVTCKQCGGNCDAGELTGGICPECLEENRAKKIRIDAAVRMIDSRPYQIRFRLEETE